MRAPGGLGTNEAERMAAVAADILRVGASVADETDTVGGKEADHRVTDSPRNISWFQKRVSTEARILEQAVPHRDLAHAVAKKPTCVAHSLRKRRAIPEWIVRRREDERVTAADAHIFVVIMPPVEQDVGVVAKEA